MAFSDNFSVTKRRAKGSKKQVFRVKCIGTRKNLWTDDERRVPELIERLRSHPLPAVPVAEVIPEETFETQLADALGSGEVAVATAV